MAGEISSGVNYEVFYHEETTAGTIYGSVVGDTDNYIALGVLTNLKATLGKEIIETKMLNSDHVSENQDGSETTKLSLEGELTSTMETFLINIMSATEKKFTIILKDNDFGGSAHYYWYLGSELSKIKFSASVGEVIKWTAELNCLDRNDSATDPLSAGQSGENSDYGTSFAATAPTPWTSSIVQKVAASGWTNTGNIDEATAWEVTIDYGVQVKHHMNGNKNPARIQRTGYTVVGKITTDFENTNHLAEFVAGNDGNIQIFTNYPTNTKSILVVGCRFESLDLDVKPFELIEMELSFKGRTVTLDFTA